MPAIKTRRSSCLAAAAALGCTAVACGPQLFTSQAPRQVATHHPAPHADAVVSRQALEPTLGVAALVPAAIALAGTGAGSVLASRRAGHGRRSKGAVAVRATQTKPAVTDATAASEDVLREAARSWYGDEAEKLGFERCGGGVNNKVYRVLPSDGGKPIGIIRIYNNGYNTERVQYEHAVLKALESKSLSFAVPRLRPTLSGLTFAHLSTQDDACMFDVIPGSPTGGADAARDIGRATAELVAAMEDISVTESCPNPIYLDIYAAHHKMNKKNFWEVYGIGPEFEPVRGAIDYMGAELKKAEAVLERADKLDLPVQQIHADLHSQNVLVDENNKVTGVLDLEFTCCDWRVMELVVGLSKFIGEGAEPALQAYVEGYSAGGGRLNAYERELVPDLVIVRVLSNVIYFTGRALAGEDSIEPLTSRAEMYADRIKWLHQKREWIVNLLNEKVQA